ncbi:hypothetical protein J5N97_005708 [Dioscorea zingiberensis]|uniref:Uncharacterized protein n=1 Tax=Dioscorea zingiberensis TaxID=325984 RepID=A0A9D5DAB4_9LILI|nr:hypothetical protein J5N97_005708 [Dioscorea zingiberensis]
MHQVKEVELMDYDWPDFSNMEDMDGLFRNYNSTFGQGSTSYADDISWFSSSSRGVYELEDTFELGSAIKMNTTSAHSGVNSNFLHKDDLLAAYNNRAPTIGTHACGEWLDSYAETEGNYSPSEQVSVHTKPLGSHHVSSEKLSIQHSECNNNSSECRLGHKQPFAEQKILVSGPSKHQTYSFHLSDQKHCPGSVFAYNPTSNPLEQMDCGLLDHQVPFSPIRPSDKFENETLPSPSYKVSDHLVSDAPQTGEALDYYLSNPATIVTQEDMDNWQLRQQLSDLLMSKLSPQQNACTSSIEKMHYKNHQFQHDIGVNTLSGDRSLELPAVEMDTHAAPESSCLTSAFSDDLLLKETSFQRLHDVLDQLDVRTTLSLRDGLYRLAKSAEQRQDFTNANDQIRAVEETGSCSTERSKNYAGYLDIETDTNPIDRAIAHLLFFWPSEGATGPASEAASIKSHPNYWPDLYSYSQANCA